MKFTKMHGCGNDYIYVDCIHETVRDPESASQALSDRRFGIGSDGLVLIMPSDIADFRMRIFNADGSEAPMCGNASRCIGRYVYERGLTDKKEISLETNSGIKTLMLETDGRTVTAVTVDIGKAVFDAEKIPVLAGKKYVIGEKVKKFRCEAEKVLAGATRTCVSVGSAHCVYFMPAGTDIGSLDLASIGPASENSPEYPNRINTEYACITDGGIVMRVWERGSGETFACGTGASATAAAAVKLGLMPKNKAIPVLMRGGRLDITVGGTYTVKMHGPAEFVFDGEVPGDF